MKKRIIESGLLLAALGVLAGIAATAGTPGTPDNAVTRVVLDLSRAPGHASPPAASARRGGE